jgi:transposase-like protein
VLLRVAPQEPPFCPNDGCWFHQHDRDSWPVIRAGFFVRKHLSGRIQRWRCLHCKRYFSAQTFRTDYWLKKPHLQLPLFMALVSCSCARQIAREFGVSPETVLRQTARLGRHSLLFHYQNRPRGPVSEPLVVDGIESFEYSQYTPVHFHLAIGSSSHYVYGFTDSELRRKGRMTVVQRRRRTELELRLGRPDPKSIEKEFAALLELVAPGPQKLALFTDEHQAYPRALRRLPHLAIEHDRTSSRAERTAQNPLWPINHADMLIRHSLSEHKRETISFARRRQCSAERLWVFVVWKNWIKSFSERRKDGSPAMRLGITDHRWTVEEVLEDRLFPKRLQLPKRWSDYYWRRIPTRRIPRVRKHRRKFAS